MHRDDANHSGDEDRQDTEFIPGMAGSDPDDTPASGDAAGPTGDRPQDGYLLPPPPPRPGADDDLPPPPGPGDSYDDTASDEPPDEPYDASGLPVGGQRRVLPIEPEPSGYVSRYLFPTEKYRGEWRRHWVHILTPILVAILATFLMGFVSSLLAHFHAKIAVTVVVVLWLLSLVWVGWRVLDWMQDRFILTNKRVMLINGLVTRKVAMMPLLRVTDMKYQQSPLGRMLNYGTFVLESAGQDQALREVPHLPNPNELYLRVVEEMYEPEAVEARLGNGDPASDA